LTLVYRFPMVRALLLQGKSPCLRRILRPT
jgi:hypothetical protein